MFFKKKSNVILRMYPDFGYIIDGRTYIYKKITGNAHYIGDKILSKSGSIFFSALDKRAQSIYDLTKKISENFIGVDPSIIKDDAASFYMMLEQDGFVASGETIDECEKKDYNFSYKLLDQDAVKTGFRHPDAANIQSTFDLFNEYYNGKPRLTSVHVEITSRCNERCTHCYIPHEKKVGSIDPDLFYNILKQCRDMGVLHLTLSGGEPMLHKHFCDFLKKCRENDFAVSLLTNLTLLNKDFIKEIKKNKLLGVQTSLYAMNSDVHDGITKKKGSFEKTRDGILMLIENEIPLQINCPIIKQNKHCYSDVAEWAKKYNVHTDSDFVLIAGFDNTTKNVDCRLSIDEVAAIIYDKSVDEKEYFRRMEVDLENKVKLSQDDYVCSVCSSSICIAENGSVYPCAGWQGYVVGDVRNSSITEIWNTSKRIQYLRNLRIRDFPKCIQCADKDYCTMCMVRNSNENPKGDPLVVNDYFCKIANINKKLMSEWKRRLDPS